MLKCAGNSKLRESFHSLMVITAIRVASASDPFVDSLTDVEFVGVVISTQWSFTGPCVGA